MWLFHLGLSGSTISFRWSEKRAVATIKNVSFLEPFCCELAKPGGHDGWWSVSAEAARWIDGLQVGEIDIADRLQCLGEGTVLQIVRQGVEPSEILSL